MFVKRITRKIRRNNIYFTCRTYFSGNVGIGTTLPGSKLDVKSGGNATEFIRGLNSSGTRVFAVRESASNEGQIYLNDSSGNIVVQLNGAPTGNSYVNTTGNVGIGTTIPGYMLNVRSGQIATTGGSGDDTATGQGIVINDTGWGCNSGLWKIVSKNNVQGLPSMGLYNQYPAPRAQGMPENLPVFRLSRKVHHKHNCTSFGFLPCILTYFSTTPQSPRSPTVAT